VAYVECTIPAFAWKAWGKSPFELKAEALPPGPTYSARILEFLRPPTLNWTDRANKALTNKSNDSSRWRKLFSVWQIFLIDIFGYNIPDDGSLSFFKCRNKAMNHTPLGYSVELASNFETIIQHDLKQR
jgi:hypothetical protein